MTNTITRVSVTLDRKILAEAMRLSHSRTTRETIAKALDELVKAEHRRALADALGTGVFETTAAELRRRRRRVHARESPPTPTLPNDPLLLTRCIRKSNRYPEQW